LSLSPLKFIQDAHLLLMKEMSSSRDITRSILRRTLESVTHLIPRVHFPLEGRPDISIQITKHERRAVLEIKNLDSFETSSVFRRHCLPN
jgi:hypothetical protein